MVPKVQKTPLQHLQDEAAALFGGIGPGPTRTALDALMVRAFDMGIKARREVDAQIIRNELTREVDPRTFEGPAPSGSIRGTHYMVSTSPDRIEDDGDAPTHYQTAEDAGDGIVHGFHGEAGTRYVLKVETSIAATYDRAWTLVRKAD